MTLFPFSFNSQLKPKKTDLSAELEQIRQHQPPKPSLSLDDSFKYYPLSLFTHFSLSVFSYQILLVADVWHRLFHTLGIKALLRSRSSCFQLIAWSHFGFHLFNSAFLATLITALHFLWVLYFRLSLCSGGCVLFPRYILFHFAPHSGGKFTPPRLCL